MVDRPALQTKLCNMETVRELSEGRPAELWRDVATGRLIIRAYNEGGHNVTDVDLKDLLDWLWVEAGSSVLSDLDHRVVSLEFERLGKGALFIRSSSGENAAF